MASLLLKNSIVFTSWSISNSSTLEKKSLRERIYDEKNTHVKLVNPPPHPHLADPFEICVAAHAAFYPPSTISYPYFFIHIRICACPYPRFIRKRARNLSTKLRQFRLPTVLENFFQILSYFFLCTRVEQSIKIRIG